eukprot:1743081-Amphidinium_carterae.2
MCRREVQEVLQMEERAAARQQTSKPSGSHALQWWTVPWQQLQRLRASRKKRAKEKTPVKAFFQQWERQPAVHGQRGRQPHYEDCGGEAWTAYERDTQEDEGVLVATRRGHKRSQCRPMEAAGDLLPQHHPCEPVCFL